MKWDRVRCNWVMRGNAAWEGCGLVRERVAAASCERRRERGCGAWGGTGCALVLGHGPTCVEEYCRVSALLLRRVCFLSYEYSSDDRGLHRRLSETTVCTALDAHKITYML